MMSNRALSLLPGFLLLLSVGLLARMLASYIPLVSHLIIAVTIGVVITNIVGVSSVFEPGVSKYNLLLETGIVLMGATLALNSLIDVGPIVLILVVIISATSIVLIEVLSRLLFDLDEKLSSLLAAGASICGVTAVIAVAGGIRAKEEHIAYAVAVILIFDAITLFSYPFIAELLSLSDTVFGIWAGLTMFSTGPVVAAGFEYSSKAGQLATITKLTRNLFISSIVIIYSSYYIRGTVSNSNPTNRMPSIGQLNLLWKKFPKFLVGFVLVMLVTNVGFLSDQQIQSAENAYQWLFLFAFGGLGLQIQIKDMVLTGKRPLLVVFISFAIISVITLYMLLLIFP